MPLLHSQKTLRNEFLDGIRVPESRVFGFRTRLANIYAPAVEILLQPEFFIPPQEVTVSILNSTTKLHAQSVKRKILAWSRILKNREKVGGNLDIGNRYVYDARWINNNNLAHLVQHHLAILGYLRCCFDIHARDVIVVLDASSSKMVIDFFRLFGFEVIKTDRQVSGWIIDVAINQDEFWPLLRYVPCYLSDKQRAHCPEKLFVSRKDSRKIVNEAEVFSFLSQFGFEKVYLEDFPLESQIQFFRHARQIVAIHGAGLGHLAFRECTESELLLVELLSAGLVVDCYRKYLAVVGGKWVGCRGEVTKEVVKALGYQDVRKFKAAAFADFNVDIESLNMAIGFGEMMK